MYVCVYTCAFVLYILGVAGCVCLSGGGGCIYGNNLLSPPVGPKRQSLSHTHTHTLAHSATGPAEPDQYFSPFKEQNSEWLSCAQAAAVLQTLGFCSKNPIGKVVRLFFILYDPKYFLVWIISSFFCSTVLTDPFSSLDIGLCLTTPSNPLSLSSLLYFCHLSWPCFHCGEWQGQTAFSVPALCPTLWLTVARRTAGSSLVPWGCPGGAGMALALWPCWLPEGWGEADSWGTSRVQCYHWDTWTRAPSSYT